MLTDKRSEQAVLEEDCVAQGAKKYWEELAENGATGTTAGQQLMRAALVPTAAAIEEWITTSQAGKASRGAGVVSFLDQISAEGLAFIVARTIISTIHERPSQVSAAVMVAKAVEESIGIDEIAKVNPRLAAKVAKQIDRYNDRNRLVFVRKGATFVDAKVIQWDEATRVRAGTVLINRFIEATGLVTEELAPVRGGKTRLILRATESCREWLEQSHARCALLQPTMLPMLCKPLRWSNPFNGGYLTKALKRPLVKSRNKGYQTTLKDWDMPAVYAAVNQLQSTEWAVNTGVLAVVKALWESNSAVGLPSSEALPMPTKQWIEGTIPGEEQLRAWKFEAAKTYERNAKMESKRIQVTQKLWVADLMVEHGNTFHFVYNLDWRGRAYPSATALNPQGDDLAKGLLQFATSKPLGANGAYWLAVHGANSFGVDKVSFDERCAWVNEHEEMILACAKDPVGDQRWAEAESPFVFLAFAKEWLALTLCVGYGMPQESFLSSIAVGFDGACNGLQNFSAMLRDEVGGKATGLVPGERPADIYTAVSVKAQFISDNKPGPMAAAWAGRWNRKLSKRNTMTVPYGVSRFGMRDQIMQSFREEAVDGELAGGFDDAMHVADCNHEAIGQVVVAARRAMTWLQEAAKVASSEKLPVRWTAPSGFLCVQDYRQIEGHKLDFVVCGRRYQPLIEKTGDKLDPRRQTLGIAPNFVHALDASHLVATVNKAAEAGVTAFAMVHDSFGTHAGDADTLRDALRGAFVEQYTPDVLGHFRDQLVEQLPEAVAAKLPALPPFGTLDLEGVRTSDYFFA